MKTINGVEGKNHRPLVGEMGLEDNLMLHIKNLLQSILSQLQSVTGPREISYPASKSTSKGMEGVEDPPQSKPDTPSNRQAPYQPKTVKEREQLGKQEMLIKQILHLPPLSGPREISYHPNRPHTMKSRFPNKDSVTMEIGGDMKKTDKNAYWQSSSEQANKTTTPPLTFQSSQSSEKRRSKIYSGTRARALDWLPTVGVIEEGLLVVSSMYKNGWTLAPLITKLVGQLLFGQGIESTTFLAGKKQPLKVAGNNSQQARNHTADYSISPSQVNARGDGDPLRHEGRNTRKWGNGLTVNLTSPLSWIDFNRLAKKSIPTLQILTSTMAIRKRKRWQMEGE